MGKWQLPHIHETLVGYWSAAYQLTAYDNDYVHPFRTEINLQNE